MLKYFSLVLLSIIFLFNCENNEKTAKEKYEYHYPDSKPLIRWWWHASEYSKDDIIYQLNWLKENNFGGVEIAWIYPVDRDTNHKKIPWLGKQWQDITIFTKNYCDSIGLHCDFTFGTLWPFGGTFVPDSLRTMVYGDSTFKQKLRLSWEHPKVGNVINHMDKEAFDYYASIMGTALNPALNGKASALFCDSWEVETRKIWTNGFADRFIKTYGYNILNYIDSIYEPENAQIHYDYMKLVSKYVIDNFYKEFYNYANINNAFTRVQCAGSPTDLIKAYSYADVPETEAMLYEPNFANIVSSAAVLDGKKEVSSETFTCLYGFPDVHFGEEQTADMKLIADALFANGVNQIVWHGMPYNPADTDSIKFYATADVGKNSSFADELKEFNSYMANVSNLMKRGKPYTSLAVYLPLEDAWIAQKLPEDKQMKWSWGEYELRYVHFPQITKGYHPIWINEDFLEKSSIVDNKIVIGDAEFDALYVDAEYLDLETIKTIAYKARQGANIIINKRPKQAGRFKSRQFSDTLNYLYNNELIFTDISEIENIEPLISGNNIPDYYARIINDDIFIFFAHPFANNLTLPVKYGFSKADKLITKDVTIFTNGVKQKVLLKFYPYSSIILKIDKNNNISFVNYDYKPNEPIQKVSENLNE